MKRVCATERKRERGKDRRKESGETREMFEAEDTAQLIYDRGHMIVSPLCPFCGKKSAGQLDVS